MCVAASRGIVPEGRNVYSSTRKTTLLIRSVGAQCFTVNEYSAPTEPESLRNSDANKHVVALRPGRSKYKHVKDFLCLFKPNAAQRVSSESGALFLIKLEPHSEESEFLKLGRTAQILPQTERI